MSWAGSINTENCFERYSFDQSFAPSPRPTMVRSSSGSIIPTRLSSSRPSRAQSASPAPRKRSFFSFPSRSERSGSVPNICANISAPVLISSTNPLVITNNDSTNLESSEKSSLQLVDQISEILADDDDDDDDDEEMEEVEEEERFMTSLSPAPFSRPLPSLPKEARKRSFCIPPQLQIHHPQPRSHFSLWSVQDESSRASSPTDSFYSRRDSWSSSINTASTCSTPEPESSNASYSSTPVTETFQYNPYISCVVQRGFQDDSDDEEEVPAQLSPASLHDHKQVTALEEYLSDLGLML